jgi:16S rRNA (uracil1498-N3)-methyltransferase
MPARFFVDLPLQAGAQLSLPAGAARHVQVLRLQPGAAIMLFNGDGAEWPASVTQMGRSDVVVQVGAGTKVDRELALAVTLALGMPANERMDGLIEKATELGVAAIQPLVCERSVLRLSGERAQKKLAHWQAVAIAASEQSGRTRVPRIEPVHAVGDWLADLPGHDAGARWVLSLRDALPLPALAAACAACLCLSGPEGGLTEAEEQAACAAGFVPVSLGARVLRADTAPLALLSHLALGEQGSR